MARWFRVYDDLADDPKVQRLPAALFKSLINLWCLASQHGGILPSIADIAFKLRISTEKATAMLVGLKNAELIDEVEGGLAPHNWNARQYKSDVSTDRVKQFRERQRNVSITVSETPPDTDSEQRQSRTERAADAAPSGAGEPVDEEPKAKLFRIGKTVLVSFGVGERRTGSLIGQWLKTRNDPEGLLAAIQYAREQNVAEPVAYISALLTKGSKNGHGQSLGDLARELAAKARDQERAAGIFRPDDTLGNG